MRRKKIDVINCHYLSPYFIHLVIAARLLRVPVVVVGARRRHRRLRRSRHGDRLVLPADHARRPPHRRLLRGAGPTDDRGVSGRAPKVTYVHNGLDLSHYASRPRTPALPRPFLLCVADTSTRRASTRCCGRSPWSCAIVPGLSLVLVGDGPLLEEHKALARRFSIEQQRRSSWEMWPTPEVPSSLTAARCSSCLQGGTVRPGAPGGRLLQEGDRLHPRRRGSRDHRRRGQRLLVEPDDPADMAAQIVALVRNPTRRRSGSRRPDAAKRLWKTSGFTERELGLAGTARSTSGSRVQAGRARLKQRHDINKLMMSSCG